MSKLADQFLALIRADAPNADYLDLARKAMAGGMSAAEVEECFALAAYEEFPEPRIAERLCQVMRAAL